MQKTDVIILFCPSILIFLYVSETLLLSQDPKTTEDIYLILRVDYGQFKAQNTCVNIQVK